MARRSSKGRALPAGDPIEGAYVPFEDVEEPWERIISRLGDGEIQMKVDRMESGGWAYCFQQTGSDLSEDFLRDDRGPGRYRIRLFVNGELKHTANLNIAAPGKVDVSALPNVAPDSNIRLMMEMNQRNMENMIRLFEAQNNRHQSSDAPSSMELLQLMIEAQKLRPSDSGMSGEKILDVLKMGMDIAKENGVKEPESFGSQLLGAIREALPMFLAGPGAPPGGAPRQLSNGQQPTQEDELKAKELLLRQGIAYLKEKSLGGSDPELYIGMVLDNLNNPLYRGVLDWVVQNEWEQIVTFDPEIGKPPHEQFFRAFYDGLRSDVSGEDSMVSDTGGPGGNIPNAVNDAGAGMAGGKKPAPSKSRGPVRAG